MDSGRSALYTQGSVRRTMLRTAFAMLAGTLAISGYNIVDTYFVGQLGKIPLAAMGFTFPVVMIVGCIFMGIAAGIMTTTAQALGGGLKFRAVNIVSSGLLMTVVISLWLGLLGLWLNPRLFRLMGASDEALPLAVGYMNIWYIGCVTASLSMAGNKLLIGAGNPNEAACMMVLGLIVNAVLDPFFIFGWLGLPAMGIRGAALATVLAQGVSALLLLVLLKLKHRLIQFRRYRFRELSPLWKLIARYAFPASLGMLMIPAASFVVTWITAQFGDAAVAAVAASGRLEGIAFIFPMALGIPMLSMVGQNYGAKLYTRIRECFRFAMGFAFFFLLGMAVVYFFFSRYIVRFFTPDAEVQEVMTTCLLIVPWGFAATEMHRYSGFFYTGCNRPAFSAWLNLFRIAGLLLPLCFLALYFRSLTGLFVARLISDGTSGLVGFLLARRMLRKLPADGQEEIR